MLEKEIFKKLEKVMDPEARVSVVDLGLIYDVREIDGTVNIKMTLTSFGCPLFGQIEADIKKRLLELDGVKKVNIKLVFDPPWTPEKMSKKAKARIG